MELPVLNEEHTIRDSVMLALITAAQTPATHTEIIVDKLTTELLANIDQHVEKECARRKAEDDLKAIAQMTGKPVIQLAPGQDQVMTPPRGPDYGKPFSPQQLDSMTADSRGIPERHQDGPPNPDFKAPIGKLHPEVLKMWREGMELPTKHPDGGCELNNCNDLPPAEYHAIHSHAAPEPKKGPDPDRPGYNLHGYRMIKDNPQA